MILDTLDTYLLIKSLHLIFVITWFAGLFYIPRLFVYHIEALDQPAAAQAYIVPQLQLMTRRLWNIITWPSAILATGFALWLLYLQPIFLTQGWMHLKLFFVVLLWLYHFKCHQMVRELQRGQVRPRYTATFMRIWNEGATILLFAIIFLVILRNTIGWIFGLAGLLGLALLLMLGIRAYKKYRNKKGEV
jgi:putative membrane protein